MNNIQKKKKIPVKLIYLISTLTLRIFKKMGKKIFRIPSISSWKTVLIIDCSTSMISISFFCKGPNRDSLYIVGITFMSLTRILEILDGPEPPPPTTSAWPGKHKTP